MRRLRFYGNWAPFSRGTVPFTRTSKVERNGLRDPGRAYVTNTPDRSQVARVPRATLSTRSSIFKDGLRWVSAGP